MNDCHHALVVEDHPEVAEALARALRTLGFRVSFAMTLAEVRAANLDDFCLIILDMQLPITQGDVPHVGSGEAALRLIRKHDSRVSERGGYVLPIIIATSFSREHDFVAKMFKNGASGFLAKPFGDRLDKILDEIREAMERAGREDHDRCPDLVARPAIPREPLIEALPVATSWKAVKIALVDGETISVEIRDRYQRMTYVDLGLAGKTTRRPTKVWDLLVACCEGRGTFLWKPFGTFGNARVLVTRLRKALQTKLAIEDDPFEAFTYASQWRTKFRATTK